jgi:large subunit ribosomal protein L5
MSAKTAHPEAPPARLKVRYVEEIRPQLIERFGYTSSMQTPKLQKVTLNMGVGEAKQDSKALKAAQDQLATIAGQQPSVRRARKSIAAFKLREGMPVGVSVTLRGDRCYEFIDRLISIAIPRIRDFRGLRARSFDGRGNYSMGVREQIIFPEIDYDAIDQVRGLDITITTSADTDVEAFALLSALGMPFSTYGRPAEFAAVDGVDGTEAEDDEGQAASAEEDQAQVASAEDDEEQVASAQDTAAAESSAAGSDVEGSTAEAEVSGETDGAEDSGPVAEEGIGTADAEGSGLTVEEGADAHASDGNASEGPAESVAEESAGIVDAEDDGPVAEESAATNDQEEND